MTKHLPLSGGDVAAALFIILIWGSNFVVMKLGLQYLTPFQLGAARYVFAAVPLLILIRPPKLHWKWVVLYGLFQGVGQFGFLFTALRVGMTASLASVLMQTQVFFTALFGFVLLRERVSPTLRIGLLFAALGLACFVMNYVARNAASQATTTVLGFVFCLVSAAMWAASNIVVRRVQQTTPNFEVVPFMVWSSLVPIIPFIILSLIFDPSVTRWQWTRAPWSCWLALAYLGWLSTILAYAIWTHLLKRHTANRVAPFSLGVPVVGIATGMILLGENITLWQWAGITLMVAALACVLFGDRFMQKTIGTSVRENVIES